jgi:hypothetical protein
MIMSKVIPKSPGRCVDTFQFQLPVDNDCRVWMTADAVFHIDTFESYGGLVYIIMMVERGLISRCAPADKLSLILIKSYLFCSSTFVLS